MKGILVVFGALVVTLAACSGGDEAETTATTAQPGTTVVASGGEVIFGEGSIPEGFPQDFPIPDAANIESTLVDTGRNRYEVQMFLPAEQNAVVDFFEQNLANAGYDVIASDVSSHLSGTDWSIEFAKDRLTGALVIRAQGTGFTSVTVDLTAG